MKRRPTGMKLQALCRSGVIQHLRHERAAQFGTLQRRVMKAGTRPPVEYLWQRIKDRQQRRLHPPLPVYVIRLDEPGAYQRLQEHLAAVVKERLPTTPPPPIKKPTVH